MRSKTSYLRGGIASLALLGLLMGNRVQAQLTPYYIAAGDQDVVTVVQGGALVGTFATPAPGLGYPIAVRNTIWLGDRDNLGAAEYTLGGTPTGNTSPGAGGFSQILDGTTDGTFNNFGVEFGAVNGTNSVTVANLDWSGQATLFTIPFDGAGIAFDTVSGTLFLGDFGGNLYQYTLGGALLNTFTPGVSLASLAYEQATDTLWSASNGGNTIFQLSKTGTVLQTLNIANANFGNNWGGEMQITAAQQQTAAPEPSSLALVGAAGFVAGFAFLRRRLRRK